MNLEVLGTPKTVRLEGAFRGETFSAPMEVWIMSLVAMLSSEQKQQFFTTLRQVEASGEYQRLNRARIVADIPMPRLDF